MERYTIQVGSFEVNCSLLERNGRALIVDPGSEPERILNALEKKGWEPEAILLTHAHFDHIGAIPSLQQKYPELPVYLHANDIAVITHPMNQLPPEYLPLEKPRNLRELNELEGVEIIHTPGHTPGGVCYYFPQESLLLSGDTLFAGSVGRTDLPGGSMSTLMASMPKLLALPESTIVIPGHGMFTTIGREKAGNPFLQ